jgi:hypothetical protein
MKRFLPALLFLSCAFPLGAQTPDDLLASVRKNFAQWDSNRRPAIQRRGV